MILRIKGWTGEEVILVILQSLEFWFRLSPAGCCLRNKRGFQGAASQPKGARPEATLAAIPLSISTKTISPSGLSRLVLASTTKIFPSGDYTGDSGGSMG